MSKEEGSEATSANLNFVITTIDNVTVDKTHTELPISEIAKRTTKKECFDSSSLISGG